MYAAAAVALKASQETDEDIQAAIMEEANHQIERMEGTLSRTNGRVNALMMPTPDMVPSYFPPGVYVPQSHPMSFEYPQKSLKDFSDSAL